MQNQANPHRGQFDPAVDSDRDVSGPGAPDTRPTYGSPHPLHAADPEYQKVYGPNGDVYVGHSVDCKELIAQGWTREPPAAKVSDQAA